MKRVLLTSNFGEADFLLGLLSRQSPNLINRIYKDLIFVNPNREYDYAICFNSTSLSLRTPKERNIAFIMEPPEIWSNNEISNLRNMGKVFVVTPDHINLVSPKGILDKMAVFYHLPVIWERDLIPLEKKTNKISMIVSDKQSTPFQKKRYQLYQALIKTTLPIHFYGRNQQPSKDPRFKGALPNLNKTEGLKSYSYSIALENTDCLNCISEKFYDCILANCIPITNAPGSRQFFPGVSFYLDFTKSVNQLVIEIENIINTPINIGLYEQSLKRLRASLIEGKLSLIERIRESIISK